MKITKLTHACVRVEHAGRVLVIDPGVWTEPAATSGADAVLITHEHADHIDRKRLAAQKIPIYAPAGAALPGIAFRPVHPEGSFRVAGLNVTAVGGRHAPTYAGQPDCPNLGYVVERACYHPGDALHLPGVPVDTLLVPMQGAWLKTQEAIEFVRAVQPRQCVGIHEGQLNDRGISSLNGWLSRGIEAPYRYLRSGESTLAQ